MEGYYNVNQDQILPPPSRPSNIQLRITENGSSHEMNPRFLDKSSGATWDRSDPAGHPGVFPPDYDTENQRMVPEGCYHESGTSTLIGLNLLPLTGSTHRGAGTSLSKRTQSPPGTGAGGPWDWPRDWDHRAKRARVESIIRGMTSSPCRYFTDGTAEASQPLDDVQDDSGGRCLSACGDNMEMDGGSGHQNRHRKQNHSRPRVIGHLKATFTHKCDGNDFEEECSEEGFMEEQHPTWANYPPEASMGELFTDQDPETYRKYQGWKKLRLMNYVQTKPDKVNKLMADILKCELSTAVNMSVDSIFQNIPPSWRSPHRGRFHQNNSTPLLFNPQDQTPLLKGSETRLSYPERPEVQVPEVQTEALSLVVQKPLLTRSNSLNNLTTNTSEHLSQPPLPFDHHMVLHKNLEPGEHPQNGPRHEPLRNLQDGCPGSSCPKPQALNVSWNPTKVRSKVNSRSSRSPQTHPVAVDPVFLGNLCVPHIKIESDVLQSIIKNNTYILNEGLTTSHLKKAKLMFFFTRYPSSVVLKTFFHDVQFTRCITSQLIKWFSNFREFYYIQMEKFARHAVMEGVFDMRDLKVGRETELFRALNMHYNKANDFQVPDRFLEVAEITLREFYVAISMGRDCDPSWKKAIYKVISKLDSDVPADFKSHTCTKEVDCN